MKYLLNNTLFHLNEAPKKSILNDLIDKMDFKYPNDYIEFITKVNGGEGQVGDRFLALWTVEEQIESNSYLMINDSNFFSKYWIFGSNGGMMKYVFEKETGSILEIDPYDDTYSVEMGNSLSELVYNLMNSV